MDESDTILIAQAQQNGEAFSALYEKYVHKVYNYFWYRIGHDRDIARDLTQETFLNAFEHLPTFRSRGYSYLTYLLTLAHNLLANYYRKKKEFSLEVLTHDIPEEMRGSAVDEELLGRVWRTINALEPIEREVMLLKHHKELSVREVAHVVRKSENAVKLVLSRAQRKVRKVIKLEDVRRLGEQPPQLPPLDFTRRKGRSHRSGNSLA
jgi:RNA polymerase sigma-70 factor, ECF subfamily